MRRLNVLLILISTAAILNAIPQRSNVRRINLQNSRSRSDIRTSSKSLTDVRSMFPGRLPWIRMATWSERET